MKNILTTLFLFKTLLFSLSASSADKESNLQLCNKSDIKVVFVVDVGDAELYLPDCSVLDTNEFMLSITYNREFAAEDFIQSSEKLIQRNNTVDVYEKIKVDLEKFNNNYQGVEKGDEYRISYTHGKGLRLQKNRDLVSSSNNRELAAAYFKVWFGDEPFHAKMKKNLLKNIKVKQ